MGPATAAVSGAARYDWRSVPFGGGGFVDGFVFHPRVPGLLYARTDIGGAYRCDVPGRSWVPLLDHLPRADADLMGVLALAVDRSDPDRIHVACGTYTGEWARKAALLSSADRGATWTTSELPFRLGANEDGRGSGERLQVDPADGRVIYLGTTKDGLWRSDDRGASFRRLKFAPSHVSLVALEPRAGSAGGSAAAVWVGSHDEPGLYVSRDGGGTFERERDLPAMAPQRAAFGSDGSLYVTLSAGRPGEVCNPGRARSGGVWKRSPAGRWTEITPGKPGQAGPAGFGWSGLDVARITRPDGKSADRVVASTIERWGEGDDIYLSDDGGAHWTALGPRSRHDTSRHPWQADYTRGQDRMGHWISDVKLDPADPARAVYGTGYGVWTTARVDAPAVAWAFDVANLEETAALELKSPTGGASLLAAMGDVAGAAWDDLGRTPGAGLFRPNTHSNRAVDVAALNPGVMARTSDGIDEGGYVSTDGGASWRPFGASPGGQRPGDGQRPQPGRVAVSANGGFLVWAPEQRPALFSRDRGRSWQPCAGWPTDPAFGLVPVADGHVEGVFYVYDRKAGTVLASRDGGATFQPSVTGLPRIEAWQAVHMVAAPGALRDLWLALPQGVLHLPAGGGAAKGVAGFSEAWLLALGKPAAGASYPSVVVWGRGQLAGVPTDALYLSDDGGASFVRIDDDRHRYGRLLSLAADPLEHGVVYIAPHGRGVIVGRPGPAA